MTSSIYYVLIFTFMTISISANAEGVGSSKLYERLMKSRMERDLSNNKPLVAHIIVSLLDHKHQFTIPKLPHGLSEGRNLRTNLYWGASLGTRYFLTKKKNWKRVKYDFSGKLPHSSILERMVLTTTIKINNKKRDIFIVADAWDGQYAQDTLDYYFKVNSGHVTESVSIDFKGERKDLHIGSMAHLNFFVGHNSLMDTIGGNLSMFFNYRGIFRGQVDTSGIGNIRSTVVLACDSKKYFLPRIQNYGVYPLIFTTGKMAPEAYTIDAIVKSWFSLKSSKVVHSEAAKAYTQYQDNSLRASKGLFWYAGK